MVDSVYCPLSPRDPQYRLYALVKQTQCRLVLVHYLTPTMFQDAVISIDIDSELFKNDVENNLDIDLLIDVVVTSDDIACIIFTSGSTGTPKAVSNEDNDRLASYTVSFVDRLKFDIEILFTACTLWFLLMQLM